MIRVFQNYVTNFAIGLFLTTIKYEMSDAQKEQSLYFVGRKINKWLILGISAAAIVVFVILMLFSYKPRLDKSPVLRGLRELILRKRAHYWTEIGDKNSERKQIHRRKDTTDKDKGNSET